MSTESQYQGSQAFVNIIPGKEESINGNTGMPSFFRSLIDLRGPTEKINFNLELIHVPRSHGAFGLPDGWTFGIPYIVPGKSLTIKGRTYAIDFYWADIENYKSGLRYVNNHGMLLLPYNPPADLPHNIPGQYAYKLTYQDGSAYYFDVGGKMTMQEDLHANFIQYSYSTSPGSTVLGGGPSLDYIQDAWGQKVTFKYQEGVQISILDPNNQVYAIEIDEKGVGAIIDPLQNRTSFQYNDYDAEGRFISEISYPTGLQSRFIYTNLLYIDGSGQQKYVPAIQDHIHVDNDKVLDHTNYSYFTELGPSTYTGAVLGYRMGPDQDGLMESNDENYRYDVLVRRLDVNGTALSATCTRFNSLHLPVREEQYTLANDGSVNGSHQSIFTYPQFVVNKHALTPYYALPICVEHMYQVYPHTSDPIPRRRISTNYDDFGNPIEEKEELYGKAGSYVLQKTTKSEYKKTVLGTQFLLSQTVTDEITRFQTTTMYTPTDDQRDVALSSTVFMDPLISSEITPFKQKAFTYDANGRLLSETLMWSPGSTVPTESIQSTTTRSAYIFNNGVLSVTTYDAQGNATRNDFDMRIRGGPQVSQTLPRGQSETFSYDILGRLVKHTNALGEISQTQYAIGPASNTVTETFFTGYRRLEIVDALGRPTKIYDNGNSAEIGSSTETNRLVEEVERDCLGRPAKSTNIFGLETTYSYDALNRPLVTTDPDGNALRNSYNDVDLEIQIFLNNDLRKTIMYNAHSMPVVETDFAGPGDSSIDYCLAKESTYDGLQRAIQTTLTKSPKPGVSTSPLVVLRKEDTTYDCESKVRISTVAGRGDNEDKVDTVTRSYVRDLFGNMYTYQKQTVYSDGRQLSNKGPIVRYDITNRFCELQNQLGQKEQRQYDSNGWLTNVTRFDGVESSYIYDACGQLLKVSSPKNSTEYTYLCEGRIQQIQQGSKFTTYTYATDGSVLTIAQDNNQNQSYELDSSSRIIRESDVFGVTRETQFNENGHISKRVCHGESIDYIYGEANNRKNQLLERRFTGKRTFNKQIEYDGWDHVKQESTKASDGTLLLEVIYQRDSRERVVNVQVTSNVCPELNKEQTYSYDGVGQMIEDTITSSITKTQTIYQYDGNSNIINLKVNDKEKVFSYNAIDQRIDAGFKYDVNGRMTVDDEGTSFTYDDKDRLQTMTKSNGQQRTLDYHADDFLASSQDAASSAAMFHSQGIINAVECTDSQKGTAKLSLLTEGRETLASYAGQDDPSYFLDQNGSTALLFDEKEYTALAYSAYGAELSEKSDERFQSHFGFLQEFKHPDSNLIYLRSRHYNVESMSFISMDSKIKENRYAYCEGDPVNFIDPSGHTRRGFGDKDRRPVVSWLLGVAAGIGLTLAGMFLIPEVGPAATIAIGAGLGAVGNVGASAIQRWVQGDCSSCSLSQLALDAVSGGVGGFFSAAIGAATRSLSRLAQLLLSGGVGGLTLTLTSQMGGYILDNRVRIDVGEFILNSLMGAAIGATASLRVGEVLSRTRPSVEPRVEPRVTGVQARSRIRVYIERWFVSLTNRIKERFTIPNPDDHPGPNLNIKNGNDPDHSPDPPGQGILV